MANPHHLAILERGVEAWNAWRSENRRLTPDLSDAEIRDWVLPKVNFFRTNLKNACLEMTDLRGATLVEANLSGAQLSSVDLSGANLGRASLRGAELYQARLWRANLYRADLSHANLSHAHLERADLHEANFYHANLFRANLTGAFLLSTVLVKADLVESFLMGTLLVNTDLSCADLSQASVFGVSAWHARLEEAIQENLVATPEGMPPVMVDNLEVAQFIYLLLHNEKIQNIIDTVGRKAVLILGPFGSGGLEVLRSIAAKLRQRGYVPIVFDFQRPEGRNYTETVKILAGLSRFVIADLSGPSVPAELEAAVRAFKIPFGLIVDQGLKLYTLSSELFEEDHVIKPILTYESTMDLLEKIERHVIEPAEAKAREREAKLKALLDTSESSPPPEAQS